MTGVSYRLAELERRIENLVRVGVVLTLDEGSARVTVRCGALVTAPLPWLTRRAGADRDWWAPEPGEQVVVLSPGGEPEGGVVLPALYQDAYPPPADARTVCRVEFEDGGSLEYDRSAGTLAVAATGPVTVVSAGLVTIEAAATVELKGASGAPVLGVVQGSCLCAFTGQPHPMVSATVKGSA